MHCNCLIPLTGILGKINVIATLPENRRFQKTNHPGAIQSLECFRPIREDDLIGRDPVQPIG